MGCEVCKVNWFKRLFNKRVEVAVSVEKPLFSSEFIGRVKVNEGWRSKPYKDTLGVLTIGFGTNIAQGITREEGEFLLINRLKKSKEDAMDLFGNFDLIREDRQEVLIEMCYQLGKTGVSKFTKFRKAVANGDWVEASAQMLNSRWKEQTPNRVKKLAKIMASDSVNIVV